MTPAARMQAAIEIVDAVADAARGGGAAADTLIARYFKERRYAGSKDRRAVRDLVYEGIRRTGDLPESGRAAMVGLALDRGELAALFDGSLRGPAPIAANEPVASAGAVPAWLRPLLAGPIDAQEEDALLDRAPLDLRINRLKPGHADIQLPDAKPIPGLPDGLRLPTGAPVEQSEAYAAGLVEVQDAGSQFIVQACRAQPGETVIDLCAGAGGKTLALASDMKGQGRLIAADTVRDRLFRLTPRAERAGAGFIETLLLNEGHEAAMLAHLTGAADLVLVDAPCSGTGTWRRNPEARWRLTPDRLDRLTRTQARILDFAAPLVRTGGRMGFAVCSILDREGSDQVAGFLNRHQGWQALPTNCPAGRTHGGGTLLTPGHDGSDGFFFAIIEKQC